MTKDEWVDQCAGRFMEMGFDKDFSMEMAKECFNNQDGDYSEFADYSPRDVADEEMSSGAMMTQSNITA